MSGALPVTPDRPTEDPPHRASDDRGRRVAVVGHDASRTGAPQVLATLLGWVGREHPGRVGPVVLLRGGPLVAELARAAPVAVLPAPVVAAGGIGGPVGRAVWRRALHGLRGDDVVLANTLAALPAAVGAVGAAGNPLVCWVHELDGVAGRVLPPAGRGRFLRRVDRWVAAGPAVGEMLVGRWGIDAADVRVVAPFVDEPPATARPPAEPGTSDRPVLLGIGAMGPRKGTDRFIDLLACWPDAPGAPLGTWLGGDPGSVAWQEAATDVRLGGLGERVRLLPTVPDVSAHLDAATLVVSTAREDPFPLVALEAGVRGVPLVATDSGGASDLLAAAGHAGAVVAPGDVLALHGLVVDLLGSPDRRRSLGEDLRHHVRAHHVTTVAAPALWSALVEGW